LEELIFRGGAHLRAPLDLQVGKRIGDPAAEGRRKQQAAGKIHGQAAWIGTGREGGGSEMHAAQQLHTQLAARVGVRTEERKSGVRHIRETLMGLAQINIAQ
jgi:hypothetical protein